MSTQQRKEMQKKYGSFYKTLAQILANYDLMGLVKFGAPADEYDYEAAKILTRIEEVTSAFAMAQLINDVFVQSFSIKPAKDIKPVEQLSEKIGPEYENAGKAVWNAWKHWKEQQ